jgi:GNAT superfamily N-acetyltransferase
MFAEVHVRLDAHRVLRSLRASDVEQLAAFYNGLGAESRLFWHRESDGHSVAVEHCDAIARYDKLRLVVDRQGEIDAIAELSFAIPDSDHERFASYGVPLDERSDVRFGPCVRDALKGTGLAVRLVHETALVAKREGRANLVLWGGVQVENTRAYRFYVREGFREVGRTAGSIDMIRPV